MRPRQRRQAGRHRALGFKVLVVGIGLDRDLRAHALEHVQERRARRIQAHADDVERSGCTPEHG